MTLVCEVVDFEKSKIHPGRERYIAGKKKNGVRACVAQSCLFGNPWSVHGILQARILEWVAIPFSQRSSQPRDWLELGSPALQADSLPSEPQLMKEVSARDAKKKKLQFWECLSRKCKKKRQGRGRRKLWECLYRTE